MQKMNAVLKSKMCTMHTHVVSILFRTAVEIESLSSRLRHESVKLGLVTLLDTNLSE